MLIDIGDAQARKQYSRIFDADIATPEIASMAAARCARVRPAEATEAASPERRIDSAPRRRAQCHAVRALRISSAHRAVPWRWLRSDPSICAGGPQVESRVSRIEPRVTLTLLNRRRTASRDAMARTYPLARRFVRTAQRPFYAAVGDSRASFALASASFALASASFALASAACAPCIVSKLFPLPLPGDWHALRRSRNDHSGYGLRTCPFTSRERPRCPASDAGRFPS